MDAFLKKMERLSEMASRRSDPAPLDAAGVMSRIHGLQIDEEGDVLTLPLGFFAGGAAAAAAAAVAVSFLAFAAWGEMSNPLTAMDSLIDVMEIL